MDAYTLEFVYLAFRVCLSFMLFCLGLFNCDYFETYRPLGQARGFLHDDAG